MRGQECGCENYKKNKKGKEAGKGVMLTIASVRRLPMPAKKEASKGSSKSSKKEEKPY